MTMLSIVGVFILLKEEVMMYAIIVGCGRIGSMLAMELSNEGHDVVIIDRDAAKLERLGSGFNGLRLHGVEYDNDILTEAGIKHADSFFAMSADDNINLVAAQVAVKIFGIKNVLARVSEPEKQYLYDQLGINAICPTSLTVKMSKTAMGY